MAFPTTPVLDDFNRANTGPPPSSAWTGNALFGNNLKVIGNQAGVPAGGGDAYWNGFTGTYTEVYATAVSITNSVYVIGRLSNPGASCNCYYMSVFTGTTQVWKVTAGANTNIDNGDLTALSAGDSFGMTIIGSTITCYKKPAAGSWATTGTPITDSSFSDGFIGLGCGDTGGIADNFGGGWLTPVVVPDYRNFPKPPVVGGR